MTAPSLAGYRLGDPALAPSPITLGDLDGARKNLRYLELLCGGRDCTEYRKLEHALQAVAGKAR